MTLLEKYPSGAKGSGRRGVPRVDRRESVAIQREWFDEGNYDMSPEIPFTETSLRRWARGLGTSISVRYRNGKKPKSKRGRRAAVKASPVPIPAESLAVSVERGGETVATFILPESKLSELTEVLLS